MAKQLKAAILARRAAKAPRKKRTRPKHRENPHEDDCPARPVGAVRVTAQDPIGRAADVETNRG